MEKPVNKHKFSAKMDRSETPVTSNKVDSVNLGKLHAAAFNLTNTGICIITEQGIIADVNDSFCEIYGYNREDLTGNNFTMVIEPGSRELLNKIHAEFFKGIVLPATERKAIHKNGKIIDVISCSQLLTDDDGKRYRIVSLSDISIMKNTQQLIQQSENKYKSIIENSMIAFFLGKCDGSILEVSVQACKMFGYLVDELKILHENALFRADATLIELLTIRNKEGQVKGELTAIRKNGEHFPCEFSSVVFKDINGEEKTSSTIIDITERKKSEEEWNLLMNNTEESFVLVNTNLEIVICNKQFEERYRKIYKKTVKKGDNVLHYSQSSRREIVADIYKKVLVGDTLESEVEIVLPDGNAVTFLNLFKPSRDNHGNITGVFVTSSDITEKKKSQKNFIKSENRFKAIIENSSDMISLINGEGEIEYISPVIASTYGYTNIRRLTEIIHSDDMHKVNELLKESFLKPGIQLPTLIRTKIKDGSYIWVEGTLTNMLNIDGINAIVANFKNVTQRKEAEDKLEINEMRFRTLIENSNDMLLLMDADRNDKYLSPSLYKILGYREEDLLGKRLFNFVHPDDKAKVIKTSESVLENPGKTFNWVSRIRKKNNTFINVEGTIINLLHLNGINSIVNNFRDVSEKVNAIELIKSSELRYRTLFDFIPYPVFTYDEFTFEFVQINQAALTFYGYTKNEMMEISVLDIRPEKEKKNTIKNIEFNKGSESYKLETIHQKKDGTIVKVDVFSNRISIDNRILRLIQVTDLTKILQINKEREIVGETLKILSQSTDLSTVLYNVLKKINLIVQWDHIEIWLPDFDKLILKIAATTSNPKAAKVKFFEKYSKDLSCNYDENNLTGLTLKNKKSIWITDLQKGKIFNRKKIAAKSGLQSAFTVPLLQGNNVVGIMILFSEKREMEDKNLVELLTRTGTHIGSEIQRRRSEDELNLFFDFSPDFLCIAGNDGYFKKINSALTHLLGYTKEELMSKPFSHFVHPEDQQSTYIQMNNLSESRQVFSFENRYVAKDGLLKWLSWTSTPMISEGLIFAVAKDVTSRKLAELGMRNSEEKTRLIMNAALDAIICIDTLGAITFWNPQAEKMFGWKKEEVVNRIFSEIIIPEPLRELHDLGIDVYLQTGHGPSLNVILELSAINKSKKEFPIELTILPIKQDNEVFFCAFIRDVTERKKEEQYKEFERRDKEALINSTEDFIWSVSKDLKLIAGNNAFLFSFLSFTGKVLKPGDNLLMPGMFDDALKEFWEQCYRRSLVGESFKKEIYSPSVFNRSESWTETTFNPIYGQNEIVGIACYSRNITENKLVERALLISNERYDLVSKATNDAIYDWDVKNKGVYRTGQGLKVLFGYDPVEAKKEDNFWENRIHPDDIMGALEKLQSDFKNPGIDICEHEYRFRKADGKYAYIFDKGFIIRNENGEALRMIGATQDITHRKETEILLHHLNEDLKKRAEELAISNKELEQFAYVASHDLQEPLRMVSSFLTQLEKKYKDILDDKAKQYIYFAVDGATRMRKIILDLLEYSRVGKREHEYDRVNMNELLFGVAQLNRTIMEEKGAILDWKNLPVIEARKTQIQQVIQNLIGNALKYQHPNTKPLIVIRSIETDTHWQFEITDNGIGIDPQFFDKIFAVFQRLHNKDEYSGTGIGLAICKKIVENHDGKMWVECDPGKGCSFYFTISRILKHE
ncbi:MAG: PAS domain S-box protein [Bacteroidia bacterium]|nr:PAS domain S-box protein [Bacteroidia bacterium]